MKKLFSVVLICALMLSAAFAVSAADEPVETFPNATYDAAQAAGKIAIDGVMDDAYKSAPVVKIENNQMVDLLYDPAEIATGEMRILWDSSYIYVYATIKDSTYAPPYKEPSWFNNVDSLWIATGANEDLSKVNCYAIPRAGTVAQKMSADSPAAEFAVKNLKGGKEVAMTTYGNAEGDYLANTPKPTGDVDSYAVEIKLPYMGGKAGGTTYIGAFICDDTDFANTGVINLVDGRSRTSEAVATDKDNGIWQYTGISEGFDVRNHFDILNLKSASGNGGGAATTKASATTKAPATTTKASVANTDSTTTAAADVTTTEGVTEDTTTAVDTTTTTQAGSEVNNNEPDGDSNAGLIAGIVVGVLVLVLGGGAVGYFLLKKKKG